MREREREGPESKNEREKGGVGGGERSLCKKAVKDDSHEKFLK